MKIIDERNKQEKKQLTFADLEAGDVFTTSPGYAIRVKIHPRYSDANNINLSVDSPTIMDASKPVIKLDRSKCKKMLVWDENYENAVGRIVIEQFTNGSCIAVHSLHNGSFLSGNQFDTKKWAHYEPIPEKKPMTALDVMYWGGVRRVTKAKCVDSIFAISSTVCSTDDLNEFHWNELVHENGETKLKWEQWKEFNWDNCSITE